MRVHLKRITNERKIEKTRIYEMEKEKYERERCIKGIEREGEQQKYKKETESEDGFKSKEMKSSTVVGI